MTPLTHELLTTMSTVSGFSSQVILSRRRQPPLPALRWMIGRELLKQHYSNCAAARELNIDHATLLHGIKTLDQMHSDTQGWALEIDIESKFEQAINEQKGINEQGAARP